jgi:hypothetical protein
MTDDDFDWNDDESIVLHEQSPIAVYTNRNGGSVIRQNGDFLQSYDQTVVVRPEFALTIAKALLKEAGTRAATIGSSELDLDAGDDMGIPFDKPRAPASREADEPPLLRFINSHREVLQAAE